MPTMVRQHLPLSILLPVVLLLNAASTGASISHYLNTGSVDTRRLATATITLGIQFDRFPGETFWNLTNAAGTEVIASTTLDEYANEEENARLEIPIQVSQGQQYKFTMHDGYGDGMKAPYGFYYIIYGTTLNSDRSNFILYENNFTTAEQVQLFTAAMPATKAPTASPPTVSPAPTDTPTSCPQNGLRHIITDPYTRQRTFASPETTFETNGLCTQHKDYASCTNEAGEDCQWIFLTSSARRGMCRVDPVTKCLQTGDCVCYTHDFHGGTEDYGNGIVFHAPISITARDISVHSSNVAAYQETYTHPRDADQDPRHPLDPDFFISKVDFTARQLKYTFNSNSPALVNVATHTFAFKLHYLYMDTPLKGRIWEGLGLEVDIDTSESTPTLVVNQVTYELPALKKWTCTQIVVAAGHIYVRGISIDRDLSQEIVPATSSSTLMLGQFSGELFDVRVYSGSLTYAQIREVGARCTGPDDPASLLATRDIDVLWQREGCESRHELYFPNPTSGGMTYGSGPFATFWVHPVKDEFDSSIWLDRAEGMFDEEEYFQHQKFQEYIWEKYYFENDMIAFNLKPYRYFNSADEIPEFARSMYNNPCRFMHQSNNQWEYPFYSEGSLEKWTPTTYQSDSDVFDLASIVREGMFGGWTYVAHETFHEFQQTLWEAYGSQTTFWLTESTASFGPGNTFPAMNDNIYAGFSMAPAYPLGYYTDDPSAQFYNDALPNVGGGVIYGSWLFWWFLAQYAELPGLVGQMCSLQRITNGEYNGLISSMRILVEARGLDFGDAWGIFIAHTRTWDVGEIGVGIAEVEAKDFEYAVSSENLDPSILLERYKTTVELNASTGTAGQFAAGPMDQRPGPFSRNCLTARGVMANRVVGISIRWDDGMGFPSTTVPATLSSQQVGCDDDERFYNSMVVVHNEATGKRRYFKMKGKTPATVYVDTGNEGPVTIYILLLPTPPTDYVLSALHDANSGKYTRPTIPEYSYTYAVSILGSLPAGAALTADASKRDDGIVNFDPATPGWWPIQCSCAFPVSSSVCIEPSFERSATASPSSQPTQSPTAAPTTQPTESATAVPTTMPTAKPTSMSTNAPTAMPTAEPTGFPTAHPIFAPTAMPTAEPTSTPIENPTFTPTFSPNSVPTKAPSAVPTAMTTTAPGTVPTATPETKPTAFPLASPTSSPTAVPTSPPTAGPTSSPTVAPTSSPTAVPTSSPTDMPTSSPTARPTIGSLTDAPTSTLTDAPASAAPSDSPTFGPTSLPIVSPTSAPTTAPGTPTGGPTLAPTTPIPTKLPTNRPTNSPTRRPTLLPTSMPSISPSNFPTTRTPSVFPTELPTLHPSTKPSVDSTCDDLSGEFFVDIEGTTGMKDCRWLTGRPQKDWAAVCIKSHRAYYLCQETCLTCDDGCNDSNSTVLFEVAGSMRSCDWLSDRLREQYRVCVEGNPAWTLCPETCGSCPQPSSSPTMAPSISIAPTRTEYPTTTYEPTISSKPTVVRKPIYETKPPKPRTGSPISSAPLASSSPTTQAPSVQPVCDDTIDVLFPVIVDGQETSKHCQWLAAREFYQTLLCVPSNVAFDICAETCGKCTDECADLSGTFPDRTYRRNCQWLADRGVSDRLKFCEEGKPARDICLETCDVCD